MAGCSLTDVPAVPADGSDPYAGGFFRTYRTLLEGAIRFRYATIAMGWAISARRCGSAGFSGPGNPGTRNQV